MDFGLEWVSFHLTLNEGNEDTTDWSKNAGHKSLPFAEINTMYSITIQRVKQKITIGRFSQVIYNKGNSFRDIPFP